MKNYGIIMELNPLHYGHKYIIDTIKEKYKPDLITVIISGYFTMRGEVSIMRKENKVKELLKLGVDLIIELPTSKTLNSGQLYAKNAIQILALSNITDLVFGVENCTVEDLKRIIDIEKREDFSYTFKKNLEKYRSQKISYSKTILELSNNSMLEQLSLKSNNTLGLEYLKALEEYPDIVPHVISRVGCEETNKELNNLPSGTAIRNAFINGKNVKKFIIGDSTSLVRVNEDALNSILKYQLISYKNVDLPIISEGIDNYIIKNIDLSKTFRENIDNLANKKYSKSRIRRTILQMILCTEPEKTKELRILGFSESGMKHLSTIRNVKMFSSIKDAPKKYSENEKKAYYLYSIITKTDNNLQEYLYPLKEDSWKN